MKEYTVEERMEIALKAMPAAELNERQQKELSEVIYTLNEGGALWGADVEQAMVCWAAIELVKAGKFTEEMRL
jgi:hypothetical protein